MSVYSRDLVQSSEVIQDTDTITYELDGSGDTLTVNNTPFTMKKIYRLLWGIIKLLGEKNRRKGYAKFNGADVDLTGTITSSGTSVTGSGTAFLTELAAGDLIAGTANDYKEVSAITNNTSLTLVSGFGSDILIGQAFKRQQTLSERLDTSINGVPLGYQDIRITFSGAVLTVKGVSKISGKNVLINDTETVTGAAGWRYIVSNTSGVVAVETIPGGEITANTTQYTPAPVFNETLNCYHSSVNTSKRILGIAYFDATNVIEVINYSSGKKKNDNYWFSTNTGVNESTNNNRLQFTASFDYTRGDGITCIDNGSGTTDNDGLRITANRSGLLKIEYTAYMANDPSAGGAGNVACNKNSSSHIASVCYIADNGGTSTNSIVRMRILIMEPVQAGDYFTFPFSISGGTANAQIDCPKIYLQEI